MRATRQARDETAETVWQAGRTMGEGAVLKQRTVKQEAGASCENQSVILWKSECDFDKVGVWFCENQPVMLWKSASDFVKIGVWFWWSRSVILAKSECDFVKISQWFCENRSVILVKSEYDFGKIGVWFWIDKFFTKNYTLNFTTYITLLFFCLPRVILHKLKG